MKKFWLIGLSLATALTVSPVAKADTAFYFSLNGSAIAGPAGGPAISGSGILTSDLPPIGGVYSIDGGIDIKFSIGGGPSLSATVIANTPANQAVYSGVSGYDDSLSPQAPNYIDDLGILFLLPDGELIQIFFDGYGDAYNGYYVWNQYIHGPTEYSWLIQNDEFGDPLNALHVSQTPEPSSMLLLGTGLLCIAGFLFRKNRLSLN